MGVWRRAFDDGNDNNDDNEDSLYNNKSDRKLQKGWKMTATSLNRGRREEMPVDENVDDVYTDEMGEETGMTNPSQSVFVREFLMMVMTRTMKIILRITSVAMRSPS